MTAAFLAVEQLRAIMYDGVLGQDIVRRPALGVGAAGRCWRRGCGWGWRWGFAAGLLVG